MDYILEGLAQAFSLLARGDAETFSALAATVYSSSLAMLASLLLGLPLGFCLGRGPFRGQRLLRTLVDTGLALPTVLIGLLVYAFLSRRGPLGSWGLLFTLPGLAIGQAILALPVVMALTASAVESLDRRLGLTLLTLGANPRQAALTTLWEARSGLLAAAVNAYGRVVTEVGIAMMVGGNIKWHTRTVTTAIADLEKAEAAAAAALKRTWKKFHATRTEQRVWQKLKAQAAT